MVHIIIISRAYQRAPRGHNRPSRPRIDLTKLTCRVSIKGLLAETVGRYRVNPWSGTRTPTRLLRYYVIRDMHWYYDTTKPLSSQLLYAPNVLHIQSQVSPYHLIPNKQPGDGRDQLMCFTYKARCLLATWSLIANMVIKRDHLMRFSPAIGKRER